MIDRSTRRDLLLIVLAQVAVVVVLRPFQNSPFIDDATYAFPVEHLLQTGRLATLEYANNVNLIQALWGALFCLPFGFSFTALRVSTWVVATGGLCAFYLLLRDGNVSRRDAGVGVAVLAFNPIFFILQFSFMTDVPFVALTLAATWAFIRAVRRRDTWWLGAAGGFASLAAGVRVVAGVFPVAAAIARLFHTGRWGRRPLRVLVALAPLLVVGGSEVYNARHTLRPVDVSALPNAPANRLADLRQFGVVALPQMSLAALLVCAATLGPSVALVAIGLFVPRAGADAGQSPPRLLASTLTFFGLLLLALHRPEWFHPLHSGATWSWREVGYVDVPNRPSVPPPAMFGYGVGFVALAAFAVTLAHLPRRGVEPIVAWQVAGHFLLVALLWLLYDRFVLILLPLTLVLMLDGRSIVRPRLAVGMTGVLAGLSILLTRDHLAFQRALNAGIAELDRRGIAIARTDVGYASNAWRQYAHSENVPRDTDGRPIVPSFTTDEVPRYQLSDHAVEGTQTLATFAYHRWLAPSGVVYLVEYPREWNLPSRSPLGRG